MNSAEITASVTAAANVIAARLTDDQLNLLGAVLTLMGEVLQTIAALRPAQDFPRQGSETREEIAPPIIE